MSEKVIGLISGGIDSPVASVIAARQFEVIPLHFCLYPMASKESSLKAIEALKDLKRKIGFEKGIIFPWAGVLREILDKFRDKYTCLGCRTNMLKIAEEICKRETAEGIVTGESLGQKASQTLTNISAMSSEMEIPIIRPMIGLNKNEIIEISKQEEIWMPDHAGCCLATSHKPRTKARSREIEREMNKIETERFIDEYENLILETKNFDEDFEDYLFQLAANFE